MKLRRIAVVVLAVVLIGVMFSQNSTRTLFRDREDMLARFHESETASQTAKDNTSLVCLPETTQLSAEQVKTLLRNSANLMDAQNQYLNAVTAQLYVDASRLPWVLRAVPSYRSRYQHLQASVNEQMYSLQKRNLELKRELDAAGRRCH
jgi:hypothetical protein